MTIDNNPRPSAAPEPLLALRVIVPFAAGYFLSYLFRTVNAVISPDLTADLGLDAANLGLLTSVYFLSFGLFQLPLGMLLDRFGPRYTEAVLLLVAASGALLFAIAESLDGLIAGRVLIGLGVSACLMASLKAIATWFPRDRLPAMNAWIMTSGGLGALIATAPVQAALQVTDWRGVILTLAILTAGAAAVIFFIVPKERSDQEPESLTQLLAGLVAIYRNRYFWQVVPLTVATQAAFLSIQGLWAGPWLADVAGQDRETIAQSLLFLAAAMVGGFFVLGQLATLLSRRGIPLAITMGLCLTLFISVEIALAFNVTTIALWLWMGFGFFGSSGILAFPLLAHRFPQSILGRVNTAANVMVFLSAFLLQWLFGAVVNLWPSQSGYDPLGYQWGFALCIGIQVLTWIWYWPVAFAAWRSDRKPIDTPTA